MSKSTCMVLLGGACAWVFTLALALYVGKFAKIGFANGFANARITDDCELVRIANYQHRAPAQRCSGELLIRRSEQLAAKWGANVRIQMVCELVRIANYQHSLFWVSFSRGRTQRGGI